MSNVNSSEAAKAVVRRNTEEVQGKGRFDVFDELFADDFIDHTPQPNTTPDKAGVRKLYTYIRAAFPDFHADIHWQLSDGDRVTTYKTYHGTHEGPFLGVAPTHRKIHFEAVDVMRVQHGKITDHWGVGNLLSLMQQIGGWTSQRKNCKGLMIPPSGRCTRGSMLNATMKNLLAALCLVVSLTCLAQSPGAKILVLERDQGEKRVRRPREKMLNPTSEFILKVTPQNSGSQHLVVGTETIPPGGVIPKHRHLGQDEIVFLQTGSAHVSLNDQDYEVHAGGMVFFPVNTWVSLRNTGAAPIQLIFIFSAPGFDEYMRCSSVPEGQPAPPMPQDEVSKCAHEGHVEYEVLSDPKSK